jgi:hypothetical protein
MKVDNAITPALKKRVEAFLLNRTEEQKASAAASTTAASTPNNKMARKMKVSETAI